MGPSGSVAEAAHRRWCRLSWGMPASRRSHRPRSLVRALRRERRGRARRRQRAVRGDRVPLVLRAVAQTGPRLRSGPTRRHVVHRSEVLERCARVTHVVVKSELAAGVALELVQSRRVRTDVNLVVQPAGRSCTAANRCRRWVGTGSPPGAGGQARRSRSGRVGDLLRGSAHSALGGSGSCS